MLCLGIESSCDETALALVRDGQLLDSVLASQAELHALFGGVVPELASREHGRYVGPLFDELMGRNELSAQDLDLVAVARGPGLLGSLLVGVAFAKGLAAALDIPFIGINHLHAHMLAVGIQNEFIFPAIGLLVSGGHTHLYRIDRPSSFTLLGSSLDDAAGEAFDKVGKVLGFSYPAGRQMNEAASKGNADAFQLPRPYLDNQNMDFSFSGLKTAAIACIQENGLIKSARAPFSPSLLDFCASFNLAVAETLVIKTRRSLESNPDASSLWLAGGVAANSIIRSRMESVARERHIPFLTPTPALCADNGAMIAFAGYLLSQRGYNHSLDMETIPRGRRIPSDMRKSCMPTA